VATSSTETTVVGMSRSRVVARASAIRVPSGDQAGADSFAPGSVRSLSGRGSEPSACAIHTWEVPGPSWSSWTRTKAMR
jgi:hypothetical protein